MQTSAFQKREWRLQRFAWIVMATIIALAAIGLFGSGPISHARIGDAGDRLQLDYERFWRMHSPGTLHLRVGTAGGADIVTVWIDRGYLDDMHIRQILPAPRVTRGGPGRLELDFGIAPGNEDLRITIAIEPVGMGRRLGAIGLAGGPELHFRQFVYP